MKITLETSELMKIRLSENLPQKHIDHLKEVLESRDFSAFAEITMREWAKLNDILFGLLGEFCGKDPEQVKLDASRDLWLDSDQALEYGIIDEVVKSKKKGK